MDNETFYHSAYDGSKKFHQRDIQTANATGFGAAADDYMDAVLISTGASVPQSGSLVT